MARAATQRRADAARPQSRCAWTRDYAPLPGIPDEFIGADGAPRAALAAVLRRASPRSSPARSSSASPRPTGHLRDAGVSYRVHGETAERRLAAQPPAAADRRSRMAARSRAASRSARELLERVLRRPLRRGPAGRRGRDPAGRRVDRQRRISARDARRQAAGRPLAQLYAADIGRGPDGRWWVLGDRTQAPSGAGYALENRLVLSRAFPDALQADERRAAGAVLRRVPRRPARQRRPRRAAHRPADARPVQRDLFRARHLARYLGFLLVEGDDLVVQRRPRPCPHHRRPEARSTCCCAGSIPTSLDPLELNAASQLGVPGLIDAIRARRRRGRQHAGLRRDRSRARCWASCRASRRRLLGEDLKMPQHRDLVVRPAGRARAKCCRGSTSSPSRAPSAATCRGFAGAAPRRWPANSRRASASALKRGDQRRAASTMSARSWCGCRPRRSGRTASSTPRPFVLRVFAAATPDGWRVMPGGFCRISDSRRARGVDGRRAPSRPTSGCSPTSRSRPTTLLPTPREGADQAHARQSAEPRRRQSVLARPLSRARRGDAAPGALPVRARVDPGRADAAARASRSSGSSACWSPGARLAGRRAPRPGRDRGRDALRDAEKLRLGAVDRAGGARAASVHPRAAVADDLAADRPQTVDPRAPAARR